MTNLVKISFGKAHSSVCRVFAKFLKSFNNNILETLNFLIKRNVISNFTSLSDEKEELFAEIIKQNVGQAYQLIDSFILKNKLISRCDALELLVMGSGIEWKDTQTLKLTSEHRIKLMDKLHQDREENKFCDLQIFIDENISFRAHKCVLASSSNYFADLIHADTKTISIFNMPQVDVFAAVLDFIYTGEIVLDKENSSLIMKNAKFLQLEELQKTCEDYMLLAPSRRKVRENTKNIVILTNQKSYDAEQPSKVLCTICNKTFCDDSALKLHDDTTHIDKSASNNNASKPTTNRKKKETNKGKSFGFSCQTCQSFFRTKSHLKRHMISHTGERKHCCTTCGKLFLKADHLTRHERTHSTERPFDCDQCEKKFKTNDNLKRHQLTHSNERPFFCELCAKQFKDKSGLIIHQKSHNRSEPICPHCGKRFKQQNRLANHIIRHNNPLTCKICEKTFNFQNHLRRHTMMHTGVRPFNCETCGRQFINVHGLKLHQKKHSGIGLHACMQCERKFLDKFHLKRHLITHTGQKPFNCGVCDRSFSRADNCEIHRRQCAIKSALRKDNQSFADQEGDTVKIKKVHNILFVDQDETGMISVQPEEIHNIAIAVNANDIKSSRYGRISKRLPEIKLVLLEKDQSENLPSTSSLMAGSGHIQYPSTIDIESISQMPGENCGWTAGFPDNTHSV